MKRQIITQYGSPEVFKLEEFTLPEPQSGEILIENHFSSVNPVDLSIRAGDMKMLTGKDFPKVLGCDFSGKVISSNNNPRFPVGMEVYGTCDVTKGGAYSTHLISDGHNCCEKPAHLSSEEAGVIAITGLTAYEMLIDHGKLKPGQKVFINGCTGGVGSIAVKMAKALEAEVTGTCDPRNNEMARLLGTNHIIDYHKPEQLETHLKSYDLVIDTSGKMSYSMFRRLGKKGARFATTVFKPWLVIRSWISKRLLFPKVKNTTKNLEKLKVFLETHDIHPVIDHSYRLREIAKAHNALRERSILGKLSVKMT